MVIFPFGAWIGVFPGLRWLFLTHPFRKFIPYPNRNPNTHAVFHRHRDTLPATASLQPDPKHLLPYHPAGHWRI